MTPHSTLAGQTGRGIATNGEGKPCTSHLNLTRTLADTWRIPPGSHLNRSRSLADVWSREKPALPIAPLVVSRPPPPPYAGYDPKEERW